MNIIELLIILAVLAMILILRLNKKRRAAEVTTFSKKISSCATLEEVVAAISKEGVYPYRIGMSISEVRKAVVQEGAGVSEFESSLGFGLMMGAVASISLPKPPCSEVESFGFRVNKKQVVSAISIRLKGNIAHSNAYTYLNVKFGKPAVNNGQFTIWRKGRQVINMDYLNNSINIINERLL